MEAAEEISRQLRLREVSFLRQPRRDKALKIKKPRHECRGFLI